MVLAALATDGVGAMLLKQKDIQKAYDNVEDLLKQPKHKTIDGHEMQDQNAKILRDFANMADEIKTVEEKQKRSGSMAVAEDDNVKDSKVHDWKVNKDRKAANDWLKTLGSPNMGAFEAGVVQEKDNEAIIESDQEMADRQTMDTVAPVEQEVFYHYPEYNFQIAPELTEEEQVKKQEEEARLQKDAYEQQWNQQHKDYLKSLPRTVGEEGSWIHSSWGKVKEWMTGTDHIVAPFECRLEKQFVSAEGSKYDAYGAANLGPNNEDGVIFYAVSNLAGFSIKRSNLRVQRRATMSIDNGKYMIGNRDTGFVKEDVVDTPEYFDNEIRQGTETFRFKYWAELAKQINDKLAADPLLLKKNLAPVKTYDAKDKKWTIAEADQEQFNAQTKARAELITAYKKLDSDKRSGLCKKVGTDVNVIKGRQQLLSKWYAAWLNFVNTFDNDPTTMKDKNGKSVIIEHFNEYTLASDPYPYKEISNEVAMRNYLWKHFENAVARVRKIRNAVLTKHMEFKAAKKIVLAEADEEEKNCRFLAHIYGEKSKYFKMTM